MLKILDHTAFFSFFFLKLRFLKCEMIRGERKTSCLEQAVNLTGFGIDVYIEVTRRSG